MSTTTRIILDCDTGIDDAMAIALAVGDPRCELHAVTTVAGNVGVELTTANSLDVLDVLGATVIPVHRGASRPLTGLHNAAVLVHGTNGVGNAVLPRSSRSIGADRGPAAIIRMALAQPGELTIVAVGPLTNLAIALNVEPRLVEWVKRLVIMGGAFWRPGNETPFAEYNIVTDPEAAAQVFAAGFPDVTVVGLDVTHETVISREEWDGLECASTAGLVLIREIGRRTFLERMRPKLFLHDPLAVGVALDPSIVGCETGTVTVMLEGEERGRTVLQPGGNTSVARIVDADRFSSVFWAGVGSIQHAWPTNEGQSPG